MAGLRYSIDHNYLKLREVSYTRNNYNQVWMYDFLFGALANGRQLKIITVEDEFIREGPAIRVDKSILAKDVIRTLADLFSDHGAPMYIRSDNGPGFVEKAFKKWLALQGTDTIQNIMEK